MSDGECHACPERLPTGTHYQRFSQSDTACRRCGAPKWLYRNGDGRPRLRLIFEFIAAFERGRQRRST